MNDYIDPIELAENQEKVELLENQSNTYNTENNSLTPEPDNSIDNQSPPPMYGKLLIAAIISALITLTGRLIAANVLLIGPSNGFTIEGITRVYTRVGLIGIILLLSYILSFIVFHFVGFSWRRTIITSMIALPIIYLLPSILEFLLISVVFNVPSNNISFSLIHLLVFVPAYLFANAVYLRSSYPRGR